MACRLLSTQTTGQTFSPGSGTFELAVYRASGNTDPADGWKLQNRFPIWEEDPDNKQAWGQSVDVRTGWSDWFDTNVSGDESGSDVFVASEEKEYRVVVDNAGWQATTFRLPERVING